MNAGRIEQLGAPAELYEQPETAFVAGFLGVSNLLRRHRHRPRDAYASTRARRCGCRARRCRAGPARSPWASARRRSASATASENRLTGRLLETAYVGVATQYVVETTAGNVIVYVQNSEPGARDHAPSQISWSPDSTFVVDSTEGCGMTDQLTRRQLLERAAIGGAAITFPGILAACGSSGSKASSGTTSVEQTLAKTLNFSNWTLYIDVNKKTKAFPSLDAFQKKTGVQVNYFEDINDNASFFGKIQGPLSRGQSIDRDIVVLTDNDRYLGLMLEEGLGREARQVRRSRTSRTSSTLQKHPSFDPNRDYTLPWQSGMTGHRLQRRSSRDPVLSVDQLLENPKLKGKVTLPELDGRRDDARDALERRRPDEGHRRDASNAAFNRIKKARRQQARSASSRATTTRRSLARATSWPRCRGRATSRSSANKHIQLERARGRRRPLDGQHADPEGRQRLHRVGLHELRLRPEGPGRDGGRRPEAEHHRHLLHPAGQGRRGGAAKKYDPAVANNPLIFPSAKTLSKVKIFDSKALNNQKYLEQWQNLISG